MRKAYGITPACVTIWNSDETFNKKGMEKYLRWLIDNGAQSISVCGSTGENIAMKIEEQKEVIEATAKFLAGEVPVYAGTGRYSTAHTIELSEFAEKVGCDGVMTILPYYLKPHKKAVFNHFRELRKHIGIDIMVYNNPWFAGYELTADEVHMLNAEGTIGSVKCAHGDPSRVHDIKYLCGDNINAFYGHDYAGLEAFAVKADGWLSAWPALFPKHCRAVQDAVVVEHDLDKANALTYKHMPLTKLFFEDKVNEVPHWQEIARYILKYQGLDFAGLPRRPLGDLEDDFKKKLKKAIDECL